MRARLRERGSALLTLTPKLQLQLYHMTLKFNALTPKLQLQLRHHAFKLNGSYSWRLLRRQFALVVPRVARVTWRSRSSSTCSPAQRS